MMAGEFDLLLDGAPLPPDAALTGLTLLRCWEAPARLSLRFDRFPGPAPVDASLRLSAGGAVLFEGRITAHERARAAGAETLDLVAEDDLSRLASRRGGGVEVVSSLRAFAARLLGGAGLSLAPGGPDFAVGRRLHRYETDLAFLYATLGRYGIGLAVRAGEARLLAPKAEAAPVRPLDSRPGGTLLSFRRHEAEAPPLSLSGWTAADDRGIERGGAGPRLTGAPLGPEEPASRLLAAETARRARAARWIEAVLSGLCDLSPGDLVADPERGAPFLLTRTEISIDAAEGARTLVSSRPPPPPAPEPAAFFAGTVGRVADPEGAGRVRVALAGFGGALTGWLPTLASGGGGTGFAAPFRPGDSALVAAPEGDPERGVVLGGIARAGGPQAGLSDGERRAGMVWRGDGLEIRLDEAAKRLRLALDGGASLELGEAGLSIFSPGRLDLSCDGQVRIRGARVDFEEA